MSITLFSLAAAAAPAVLRAIGDFARQDRATFNAILKQSKPIIHELPRAIDDAKQSMQQSLNKYEDDGWFKE